MCINEYHVKKRPTYICDPSREKGPSMGIVKSIDPGQPCRLTNVETSAIGRFSVYDVTLLPN